MPETSRNLFESSSAGVLPSLQMNVHGGCCRLGIIANRLRAETTRSLTRALIHGPETELLDFVFLSAGIF
jgi:hypothetical protein